MTFLSTIKERFPALFFLLQHLVLLSVFTYTLLTLKDISFVSELLCQWDCHWYMEIKEDGFFYSPDSQNTTGFFPFFPYLWKMTTLNVTGVSIANAFIFGIGFFFLIREFKPEESSLKLFLSVPCILFFIVPYPEALFFLFSGLMLVGIRKRDRYLAALSVFLAVFTRPVGLILAPAFLVMIIFLADKRNYFPVIREFLLYAFVAAGATLLMFYIHFLQTGVWFAYFKTHEHWGHFFRLPQFPLTSSGDIYVRLVDGMAMMIGGFSVIYLVYLLIQKLRGKIEILNRSFLLSLLTVSGVFIILLFFQGGDIRSLGRFVFCSAFYFILVLQTENKRLSFLWISILIATILTFWIMFGMYNQQETIVYCLIFTAYLSIGLFGAFYESPWKLRWVQLFYTLSLLAQSFLVSEYLSGKWIG